jgi:1-deoxy-D-xylulose-5-phosphate reductoisomerase
VLNAANEVAVEAFLAGALGFTSIPRVIASTLDAHQAVPATTLTAVREADAWARQQAGRMAAG